MALTFFYIGLFILLFGIRTKGMNENIAGGVELFIVACLEGDPAQHLIKEVLFRAAKRAGKSEDLNLRECQNDNNKSQNMSL